MPILLALVFALSASAVTISRVQSVPEGTSVLTYKIEKGKGTQERKTNAFGPENDYRLGTFVTKENLAKTEKAISALLVGRKSTRNSPPEHAPFFMVNGQIITPGSPLSQALEKEFAKLQTTDWEFQSGVELATDLSELKEVKDGKITQKKPFAFDYHCDPMGKKKICRFDEGKILYVP